MKYGIVVARTPEGRKHNIGLWVSHSSYGEIDLFPAKCVAQKKADLYTKQMGSEYLYMAKRFSS
jgi:hypothetical protein